MALFVSLFLKLLPLYLMIGLGYVSGRVLQVGGQHLASLMLYIITPVIVFSGVMSAPLSLSVLSLPFWVWGISILISLIFLQLGKARFRDSRANILALAVGTGNTGYFGIPVALILFGDQVLGLYVLCMLGTTLHENSVGFYLAAKGRYSARECLLRVFKLPSLYAFLIAAAINMSGGTLPDLLQPFVQQMRGAYTVLGMMIIGMGVAGMRAREIGGVFTALAFSGKFLLWPVLILIFCGIDSVLLHLFNQPVYLCLFLVAITPVAGNTVVIATLLNLYPRMVASTALLSTFFALFYIPLMTGWVMPVFFPAK